MSTTSLTGWISVQGSLFHLRRARGPCEAPGGPNDPWGIFQHKYLAGHGTSLEYKPDQRRSLLIARAPGM